MDFDPTKYGAVPVQEAPSSGGFDPTKFGATPVSEDDVAFEEFKKIEIERKKKGYIERAEEGLTSVADTVFEGGKKYAENLAESPMETISRTPSTVIEGIGKGTADLINVVPMAARYGADVFKSFGQSDEEESRADFDRQKFIEWLYKNRTDFAKTPGAIPEVSEALSFIADPSFLASGGISAAGKVLSKGALAGSRIAKAASIPARAIEKAGNVAEGVTRFGIGASNIVPKGLRGAIGIAQAAGKVGSKEFPQLQKITGLADKASGVIDKATELGANLAGDITRGGLTGAAVGGTIGGITGQGIPEGIGAGAGLGAAGHTAGKAVGKAFAEGNPFNLDKRYETSKNAEAFKEVPSEPFDYGTPIDAANNDSVSRMPQESKDMLYKWRNIIGKDGQAYVLPDDVYAKRLQKDAYEKYKAEGMDDAEAQKLASTIDTKGFFGSQENGVPTLYFRESSFGPEVVNHEVGHFIKASMESIANETRAQIADLQKNNQPVPPELQAKSDIFSQIESAVPKGRLRKVEESKYLDKLFKTKPIEDQMAKLQEQIRAGDQAAQQRYNDLKAQLDLYNQKKKEGLSDQDFSDEWIADQFSLAAQGLRKGKKPNFVNKIAQGINDFLDAKLEPVLPEIIKKYWDGKKTPIGYKPSFVAQDVFDAWLANKAASVENAATKTPVTPQAQENVTPPPVEPIPVVMDPSVVVDSEKALQTLGVKKAQAKKLVAEAVNELNKEVPVGEVITTQMVTTRALQSNKISSPAKPAKSLSSTKIPRTKPLEALKKAAEDVNKPLEKLKIPKNLAEIEKPMEQFEENAPRGTILEQPEETNAANIRAPKERLEKLKKATESEEPTEKKPTETTGPTGEVDVREVALTHDSPKGLRVARHRRLKEDKSVVEEPQKYLKGTAIDIKNPVERQIVEQARRDSGNPKVFDEALKVTQEALKDRQGTSTEYASAFNDLQNTPTGQTRVEAQEMADFGLGDRVVVQKNSNPIGIEVRTVDEPVIDSSSFEAAEKAIDDYFGGKPRMKIFTSAEQAKKALGELFSAINQGRIPNLEVRQIRALQERFIPTEKKTYFYSKNYSPDKLVGNAILLQDSLSDMVSNKSLMKELGPSTVQNIQNGLEYLSSDTFDKDLADYNKNSAHGYRGDGRKIEGTDITPDPNFKPRVFDNDFHIQVLNALQGGPVPSFFKEASQNIKGLRDIDVETDPKKVSANPFWNTLVELGDNLKVVERGLDGKQRDVTGIKNILSDPFENIRLDRIKSIKTQPKMVESSGYVSRAIGFMPENANGDPISKEEFKKLTFGLPVGGSSMTPKKAFEWRDLKNSTEPEVFESAHELANYNDDFRIKEALGKGYEHIWPNTLNLLDKFKKDQPITIYRAAPKDRGGILPGGYVSESKQYAKEHGESILGGDFKIYELKVKPSELATYGDPHEFLYIPESLDKGYQEYLNFLNKKNSDIRFMPKNDKTGKALLPDFNAYIKSYGIDHKEAPRDYLEDARRYGRGSSGASNVSSDGPEYRRGQKTGTQAGSDQASQRLIDWAKEKGLLTKPPTDTPIHNGLEHNVNYIDKKVAIKSTKNYGFKPDLSSGVLENKPASLEEYLDRLKLQNEVFPTDIKVIGFFEQPTNPLLAKKSTKVGIIISQKFIKGVDATEKEITNFFNEEGYRQIEDGAYYNKEKNLGVFDAHPKNVLKTKNGLVPFDVVVIHPDKQMIKDIEKKTRFSPLTGNKKPLALKGVSLKARKEED